MVLESGRLPTGKYKEIQMIIDITKIQFIEIPTDANAYKIEILNEKTAEITFYTQIPDDN